MIVWTHCARHRTGTIDLGFEAFEVPPVFGPNSQGSKGVGKPSLQPFWKDLDDRREEEIADRLTSL
jgi:hypothetical protein